MSSTRTYHDPTNMIGSEFEVHGGRSILSGVSGLPYYCAPCVCVPAVIKVLAVWQSYIKKNKKNGRVSGVAAVQTNKQTNESRCQSPVRERLRISH